MKDEEGYIVKLLATCTNINEQTKQEEWLEQRGLERTQASNRLMVELQQFAFVASPDLWELLRKIQRSGDRLIRRFGSVWY